VILDTARPTGAVPQEDTTMNTNHHIISTAVSAIAAASAIIATPTALGAQTPGRWEPCPAIDTEPICDIVRLRNQPDSDGTAVTNRPTTDDATTSETASDTTPETAAVEILPPDEPWGGMSRGEWDAQWWQRAATMPADISPYTDTTGERCGYQQSGPVFILPGNFAGGIVERTCVVAEGTAIYVLVAGTTCSTVEPPPYFGSTEDELRACASAGTDEITDFEARVNGHEVADPDAYRTTSPMFTITFPENNIVGIDPGVGQVVSEAISFIIAPPPPGEYEIDVSVTLPGNPEPVGVTTTVIVEAPQVIEPPTT
jgi:hypothetical protein